MQIQDQVFLISGGASGLGAATARLLAQAGGKMVIADVDHIAGTALADELDGHFVSCDVSSASDADNAISTALKLGPLRGLIHCAGIAPAAKILGKQGIHPLELFTRTVTVNLIGTFNMNRLAAHAMSLNTVNDQGERGVIVNTASIAAFDAQIGQAAYAASKGGVVSMTLALARDLAQHAIRVMTIAPGVFATTMVSAMPAQVQATLSALPPFPKRLGKPDEFAGLVHHILQNPMLNGAVIRLDGALRMPAR